MAMKEPCVSFYINEPTPQNVPGRAQMHVLFKPWVPVWLRWLVAKLFTKSYAWTG